MFLFLYPAIPLPSRRAMDLLRRFHAPARVMGVLIEVPVMLMLMLVLVLVLVLMLMLMLMLMLVKWCLRGRQAAASA